MCGNSAKTTIEFRKSKMQAEGRRSRFIFQFFHTNLHVASERTKCLGALLPCYFFFNDCKSLCITVLRLCLFFGPYDCACNSFSSRHILHKRDQSFSFAYAIQYTDAMWVLKSLIGRPHCACCSSQAKPQAAAHRILLFFFLYFC